jgi:hypothetical protein
MVTASAGPEPHRPRGGAPSMVSSCSRPSSSSARSTAPATATRRHPLLTCSAAYSFRQRVGRLPRDVVADRRYGTLGIYCCLAQLAVRAAIPQRAGKKRNAGGVWSIRDFRYDAECDIYTCPAGDTLGPASSFEQASGWWSTGSHLGSAERAGSEASVPLPARRGA